MSKADNDIKARIKQNEMESIETIASVRRNMFNLGMKIQQYESKWKKVKSIAGNVKKLQVNSTRQRNETYIQQHNISRGKFIIT